MLSANAGLKADHLAELADLIGDSRIKSWREIVASVLAEDKTAIAYNPAFMKGGKARYRWDERIRRTANAVEWVFGPAIGNAFRAYVQNSSGGRRSRCTPQTQIAAICDRSADTIARHLPLLRALGVVSIEPRSGLNRDKAGRRFAPGGRRLAHRATVQALPLKLLEAAEKWIAHRLGIPLEILLQFEPSAVEAIHDRKKAELETIDRVGLPVAEPAAWRPPMQAKRACLARRMIDATREHCGATAGLVLSVILGATEGGLKTVRLGQEEIATRCGISREWVNKIMADLRARGTIETVRQAAEGIRFRDQVRVTLSPAELAEREAEKHRAQAERRKAAKEAAARTYRERLADMMRAVRDDINQRRETSEESRAIRQKRASAAGPWQPLGASICEVIAGANIQLENKADTAPLTVDAETIEPRPPPPRAVPTRATINQKPAAQAAEGRSFANRQNLDASLDRFKARFRARKPQDAQQQPKPVELTERREEGLGKADSLNSREFLQAAGNVAYGSRLSIEKSCENAREKLVAKFSREGGSEGNGGKQSR